MENTTRVAGAGKHLSLVRRRDTAGETRSNHPRVSLRGAPYRPGELATSLSLLLPPDAVDKANEQARIRRVPVELWIRSAVDASRTAASLSTHTGLSTAMVHLELDRDASGFCPMLVGESELLEYRRLLLRGEPGSITRVPPSGRVELLLPLELRISWRREAAAARLELDSWVATLLAAAPEGALSWEAAAAGSGERLAEWAYASWLWRSTRSSA
jgi:hypothetical protein